MLVDVFEQSHLKCLTSQPNSSIYGGVDIWYIGRYQSRNFRWYPYGCGGGYICDWPNPHGTTYEQNRTQCNH